MSLLAIDDAELEQMAPDTEIAERIDASPLARKFLRLSAGELYAHQTPSEGIFDLALILKQHGADDEQAERLLKIFAGPLLAVAKPMTAKSIAGRPTGLANIVRVAGIQAQLQTPAADRPTTASVVRSLADIREHPELLVPPPVVVPGVAWKGRKTLVASREGLGKSTLFAEAANAVTTGQPFLGRELTVRGTVLWVLSEEHVGDLHSRALRFDPAKSGETRLLVLDHPTDPLEELARAVTDHAPRLVILDSLHSWAGGLVEHASQSDSWRPILELLERLARAPDAPAFLISAEAVKSTGDYRDSSSIGHAVDVVFTLRDFGDNDPITRELVVKKVRIPAPVAKIRYQLQAERLVKIDAPDAAADLMRQSAADDSDVLVVIQEEPGITVLGLKERLKWGHSRVKNATARLLKQAPAPIRDEVDGRKQHHYTTTF